MNPIPYLFLLAYAPASVATFQQGGNMRPQDDSAAAIDQAVNSYLDARENKSIVTPGDFTEYPLELKSGQIVIADARSDAFDPALELVDEKGTALEKNDDRYPGDQRPLLFWRALADGKYALRVRSFANKGGGQAFLRFKVYESMDLQTGAMSERMFEQPGRLLLRIPMKKGQVKQVVFETPNGGYYRPGLTFTISSLGLPSLGLTRFLDPAIEDTIMAPVDGDYYVFAEMGAQRRKVRAAARLVEPQKLSAEAAGKSVAGTPTLWEHSVKAGEIIEVTTPELSLSARLVVSEEPDVSKHALDPKNPDANPFFPVPPEKRKEKPAALLPLPARARDGRIQVFVALRDAKLWLASNGQGAKDRPYSMNVRPAAKAYTDGLSVGGKLRIGNTDYWVFESKVGDVMTFDFTASGFAEKVVIKAPVLYDVFRADAMPDQATINWRMITERPGRYIVAVSSLGDGGGGDYSLTRKVYPPKEFGKGKPAAGGFADGQTQVWKFSAKPEEPLYVHWSGTGEYAASIRDASGTPIGLNMTRVDAKNQYGILKVDKPTTFLIVLTSEDKGASYSIDLSDLPGYAKGS